MTTNPTPIELADRLEATADGVHPFDIYGLDWDDGRPTFKGDLRSAAQALRSLASPKVSGDIEEAVERVTERLADADLHSIRRNIDFGVSVFRSDLRTLLSAIQPRGDHD